MLAKCWRVNPKFSGAGHWPAPILCSKHCFASVQGDTGAVLGLSDAYERFLFHFRGVLPDFTWLVGIISVIATNMGSGGIGWPPKSPKCWNNVAC